MQNKKQKLDQQISTKLGTIVLIIIALTVGVFVWKVGKNQEVAEQSQNIVTRPKVVVSQQPQKEKFPAIDPQELERLINLTENWKTYKNKTYGFEFKYPQDYSVKIIKNNPDIGSDVIEIVSNGKCIFKDEGGKSPCTISIHQFSPETESREEINQINTLKNEPRNNKTGQAFSINENVLLIDPHSNVEGFNVFILAKNGTFNISSGDSVAGFQSVFQGVYLTFKELHRETTLKKLGEDNVHVYYDGKIIISGNYQELSPSAISGETLCFYADNATAYLIPRDPNLYGLNNGDKRNPWFCFSNQNSAKNMFGISDKNIFSNIATATSCIKGKATIEVSNYVVDERESEAYDTAKLEKIVSKEEYAFLEECN